MKRPDAANDPSIGKYIARATPLGTVTDEMVIKRAREVAVTNGRNGNDYTQNDYDEAKRELTGPRREAQDSPENKIPSAGGWLAEGSDEGHRAPVRPANDGETFAEELVEEGVEEATHHQMLVGNQETREKE
jgi:hypothetical protein